MQHLSHDGAKISPRTQMKVMQLRVNMFLTRLKAFFLHRK
jgi:hypothetical protein